MHTAHIFAPSLTSRHWGQEAVWPCCPCCSQPTCGTQSLRSCFLVYRRGGGLKPQGMSARYPAAEKPTATVALALTYSSKRFLNTSEGACFQDQTQRSTPLQLIPPVSLLGWGCQGSQGIEVSSTGGQGRGLPPPHPHCKGTSGNYVVARWQQWLS